MRNIETQPYNSEEGVGKVFKKFERQVQVGETTFDSVTRVLSFNPQELQVTVTVGKKNGSVSLENCSTHQVDVRVMPDGSFQILNNHLETPPPRGLPRPGEWQALREQKIIEQAVVQALAERNTPATNGQSAKPTPETPQAKAKPKPVRKTGSDDKPERSDWISRYYDN